MTSCLAAELTKQWVFDSFMPKTAAAKRSIRFTRCRSFWQIWLRFRPMRAWTFSLDWDAAPCTPSFSPWTTALLRKAVRWGRKRRLRGASPLRTPPEVAPSAFSGRSVAPRGDRRPPPDTGSTNGYLRPLLDACPGGLGFGEMRRPYGAALLLPLSTG